MKRTLLAVLAVMGLTAALTPAVALGSTSASPRSSYSDAQVTSLQDQTDAAQPAADARVTAAARQGSLGSLVRGVLAQGAPHGATTPSEYALLRALAPHGSLGSDAGITSPFPALNDPISTAARAVRHHHRVRAVAAGCWRSFSGSSHIWESHHWNEAGITVAHWEKDHGWWCGNGYQITSNGLPGYYSAHNWATPPFCLVIADNGQGWDAPHESWAHGRMLGKVGTYTPWASCSTWLPSAYNVVRIAANGHYDYYNDY